jgi:hypothetical protein
MSLDDNYEESGRVDDSDDHNARPNFMGYQFKAHSNYIKHIESENY